MLLGFPPVWCYTDNHDFGDSGDVLRQFLGKSFANSLPLPKDIELLPTENGLALVFHDMILSTIAGKFHVLFSFGLRP